MAGVEEMMFGEFVRDKRLERKIGLREMARMISVSPTYLSQIERDAFPPPAENKVKKIAEILELDADELLARAGRVSSDLTDIIKQRPRVMADFLRSTDGMTPDDLAKVTRRFAKRSSRS